MAANCGTVGIRDFHVSQYAESDQPGGETAMMQQLSLRVKVMAVVVVALTGCVVVAATGIYTIGYITRVLDTLAVASERVETLQRMDTLTSEVSAHEKQLLLELDRPKMRALEERIQKADAEIGRASCREGGWVREVVVEVEDKRR